MAWTAPRTWVTSEIVTATIMNTHIRDNLNWIAPTPTGWTTYTSTLTTTGTAHNVWGNLQSRYWRSGNFVLANMSFQSGAGGGNYGTGIYLYSLPFAASGVSLQQGTGVVLDNSTGATYAFIANLWDANNCILLTLAAPSGGVNGTTPFAMSTLDKIYVTFPYEAA